MFKFLHSILLLLSRFDTLRREHPRTNQVLPSFNFLGQLQSKIKNRCELEFNDPNIRTRLFFNSQDLVHVHHSENDEKRRKVHQTLQLILGMAKY